MILKVMSVKDEVNATKKTSFFSENTVKALFLSSLAGFSALASFSYAFYSSKKQDPIIHDVSPRTFDNGTQLAFRALKWGTFYACGGCGLIVLGAWIITNSNNMEGFRTKIKTVVPKIPKNYPPQSKTEFESVSDLLQYLDDEYSTKKVD